MADETVLITGSSSGIGRATARRFADADWTVYASARDADDVADLEGCEPLELDVTDPPEVAEAVERVVSESGGVDCLVNNAGYGQLGAVEDVPPRRVRKQFDVNVFGPHRLVREVLPHMRAADGGRIINLSSVYGRVSTPAMGVYSGSKHALEAMTDALRAEVADQGVDVVLVEPGPVETDFRERAESSLPESERSATYDALYDIVEDSGSLRGIVASDPEEVADVVLQAATCADPAARYPVGPFGDAVGLARFLPSRLRDRAYGVLARLVR